MKIKTDIVAKIPMFDLFPHSRITPKCRFHLTYSYICLELFLRGQSMQMHGLAKDEWLLFTEWKWMKSTKRNSDL